MAGMILSFTVMYPLLEATPDQAQVFLADHHTLAGVWTWIVDAGTALTLVILVLALHRRSNAHAPTWSWLASASGLLWAGLIVASSDLMLHHFGVVPNLFGAGVARLAAWAALARSCWVLFTSLAALRMSVPVRTCDWVGLLLGIVGLLTTIPEITEIAFMVFGPGMMVWTVWVGIGLLRHVDPATAWPEDALNRLSPHQ